ncbi:pentatricopeptide repeat-containing protein At3g48250, chloroplastic-like [Silene latifolia]|uniref:pentatricopeptide repeat-containing protein At3g48250, chloroplastic-like n=1 Tax=Silene latifolia TaxID=37657 RepID=UPI003D78196D
MNKSKLLNLSIALANSVSSTRRNIHYYRFNSTQVNRSSNFRQFHHISLPTKTYNCYNPFNFQQNFFFSSKPESFVDLVLSNDWSQQIENELEKLNPKLTHESVVYVLMNSNTNPKKSLDFFNWVCNKNRFDPSFTPYIILLRCLVCREFISEFWNVFSEIKRKGFYLDHRDFQDINVKLTTEKLKAESVKWSKRYQEMIEKDVEKRVVNEVLKVILLSDWGDEVECKLLDEKLKFPLTENFVLRIIAELRKQPLKAFRFFEFVGSWGEYEHDSVTYNAMTDVLAQPKSLVEFWDFVKQMRLKGINIDIYTYLRCSKSLPRKDTVELFKFMMDGPYKPSLCHVTTLLSRLSNKECSGLLYRVFGNFGSNVGNAPGKSKVLYDIVHRTLCKVGKMDEAKKIVEDLRNSGYKPDNFSFGQQIFCLCKTKRFDEAGKVPEQMEVEGVVPNVKTWTMLIRGHSKGKQMTQALSCLAKMKEKNVSPDPETLLVLLNGFLSEKKFLDAYKFFTEFSKTESQVKSTKKTYKLMIQNLTEAGKLEEALQVVSMMKKDKIRVSPAPITQYIAKYGSVADAKRLLVVLSPTGTSYIPVYKEIFEAFFQQGRYSDVIDLIYTSPPRVREHTAIREMYVSCQATPLEDIAKLSPA